MSWDNNPYDNPENFGLTVLGELGDSGGYEWDVFAVYVHDETGDIYWYEGSGCSCNSPSDDVSTLDDLNKATSYETFSQAITRYCDDSYRGIKFTDAIALMADVAKRMHRTVTG